MTCPTLALVYEIQDELIYNQLLYKSTACLGNDEEENKKIIGIIFDKYRIEFRRLEPEEQKRFENDIMKKYMQYMKPPITDPEKAYATYKVQQLTNDDIDLERAERARKSVLEAVGQNNPDLVEKIKGLSLSELKKLREKLLNRQNQSENKRDEEKKPTLFDQDAWKAAVGDRRLDDISNIIEEIKKERAIEHGEETKSKTDGQLMDDGGDHR